MNEIQKKFSKIYDSTNAKIYRFIYLKVSSQETAEDLAADVFMRLWDEIRNPESEIRNPQAYLYQIARNVVADHYKLKKVKTVAMEEIMEIADFTDPTEGKALVNIEMDRVKKALLNLNDDYQDLVIWRYLDELSFAEIAQITGKTEDNVRVGVHRALQALKQRLEGV